jgi:hypothetical protein
MPSWGVSTLVALALLAACERVEQRPRDLSARDGRIDVALTFERGVSEGYTGVERADGGERLWVEFPFTRLDQILEAMVVKDGRKWRVLIRLEESARSKLRVAREQAKRHNQSLTYIAEGEIVAIEPPNWHATSVDWDVDFVTEMRAQAAYDLAELLCAVFSDGQD